MKKLISLLSAVAMLALAAVPASAALTYAPDEDGWYVISEAPTDAEVAAYAPTLTATHSALLETEEDLKAISTTVNKKFKSKLTTHDIYKITYDMANIGTFVNAYDEDYNNAFFGLYDITIGFDAATLPEGYEVYALTYTLPDASTGSVGVGTDTVTGILNTAYTAAGVAYDTIFPARTNDEGIVVDAGTYKAEYILAYPKTDDKVTLPFSGAKVTYKTTVGTANSGPATTNITCDDLVFEKEQPLADIIVTPVADDGNVISLGKAWDVNFKYEAAKAYTATFTDLDEADEAKKTLVRELDFSGIAEWTDGSRYSFVTLLKTEKTNVELAVTNN